MPDTANLGHYAILTSMLAPALLMAATASLLVSANARLARVVDRLRMLVIAWEYDAPDRAERDVQIQRHRRRAQLVLRACQLLYAALGGFVGTSLALAVDALLDFAWACCRPCLRSSGSASCCWPAWRWGAR